ncbi:MAG: alpha/beta hydrolase, partial [Bacteroidota bacterium]
FDSALDYYEKSQSLPFIPCIQRPTLLINALDDPFLGDGCYPREAGERSKAFHYLETKYGGHVSYAADFRRSAEYWHEKQTIAFFQALDILNH